MALLALLPAMGIAGCFESGRTTSEIELQCYAVATATERDLTSRIHVRDELKADGNIPSELELEYQAYRRSDVKQLSAATSIKNRFGAAWATAEPESSKAIQEDADRKFEEDRIQFLNGECGGELSAS